jgi:hypothetical protein
MDAAKKAEIQAHARAIAALLYEEADAEQVQTLAGIEEPVRAQVLEHVSPEIGVFYRNQQRHDSWTPPDARQHPGKVEDDRPASATPGGESLYPMESLLGTVLLAAQC